MTARKTRKARMRSAIAPRELTTPMMASSRVLDDEDAPEVEPLEFSLEPEPLSEVPGAFVTGKLDTMWAARSL